MTALSSGNCLQEIEIDPLVWDSAQKFAFVAHFQMVLVLLVWAPHC